MKLRFYKEEDGRWYVDLPEWEGEKADLEMVAGADMMLDILSIFGDNVWLKLEKEPFEGSQEMSRCTHTPVCSGSYYWLEDYTLEIWLCDVTKFVFGDFPDSIYYQVIKQHL